MTFRIALADSFRTSTCASLQVSDTEIALHQAERGFHKSSSHV